MKTNVLKALRKDHRNWWYHKELIQQGRYKEYKEIERRSMKSEIKNLRTVHYWDIAGDGCTIVVHGRNSYSVCGGYRAGKEFARIVRENFPRKDFLKNGTVN